MFPLNVIKITKIVLLENIRSKKTRMRLSGYYTWKRINRTQIRSKSEY